MSFVDIFYAILYAPFRLDINHEIIGSSKVANFKFDRLLSMESPQNATHEKNSPNETIDKDQKSEKNNAIAGLKNLTIATKPDAKVQVHAISHAPQHVADVSKVKGRCTQCSCGTPSEENRTEKAAKKTKQQTLFDEK
ncbi:hypothetical protein ABG067_001696 [Albugo candida]